MALERIRKNQQGVGNKHFKMYQFKEALLDPMAWAFFAFALIADIPNGMWSTTWKAFQTDIDQVVSPISSRNSSYPSATHLTSRCCTAQQVEWSRLSS